MVGSADDRRLAFFFCAIQAFCHEANYDCATPSGEDDGGPGGHRGVDSSPAIEVARGCCGHSVHGCQAPAYLPFGSSGNSGNSRDAGTELITRSARQFCVRDHARRPRAGRDRPAGHQAGVCSLRWGSRAGISRVAGVTEGAGHMAASPHFIFTATQKGRVVI